MPPLCLRSLSDYNRAMLSFRYHSTVCCFAEADNGALLAFDAGWPCTLREYQRGMKAAGLRFSSVKWAFVSHFHMDHAGLVSDFLDSGIQCFVFENQHGYISAMEKTILRTYPNYKHIDESRLNSLTSADSRVFLKSIGIEGEVLVTAAHSPDSVSLVLDSGEAAAGDLWPPNQLDPADKESQAAWRLLREHNAKTVWLAHAGIVTI